MPRSIRDPRLSLAVGERYCDERGAKIVRAEMQAILVLLEELGPLHTSELEGLAEPLGQEVLGRAGAIGLREDMGA